LQCQITEKRLRKMPIIQEITQFLEEFAPLHLQEDYDNAGLIIGDFKKEVKKVIFCLDSIEAVVDEAIAENAEMIIAHHPIIFKE
jgi:putative NIF3 family GTP cyclohydrolase 1 type 2